MFNPKMEAMSRDERHALQSERLRWTVKHEYENVPVYRARMDAVFGAGATVALSIRPEGAVVIR